MVGAERRLAGVIMICIVICSSLGLLSSLLFARGFQSEEVKYFREYSSTNWIYIGLSKSKFETSIQSLKLSLKWNHLRSPNRIEEICKLFVISCKRANS